MSPCMPSRLRVELLPRMKDFFNMHASTVREMNEALVDDGSPFAPSADFGEKGKDPAFMNRVNEYKQGIIELMTAFEKAGGTVEHWNTIMMEEILEQTPPKNGFDR